MYDPLDTNWRDDLEAQAINACLRCHWCTRGLLMGGNGSANDQFEVDRTIFPSDTPFANGEGALSYSHPDQKLVASCHWCNM